MLKSTAGGGGIGMRVCRSAARLSDAFEAVKRLGQNNFSDSGVFIEKYISAPAIWKCRSLVMGAVKSSPSAYATARCSGATKRCWKKAADT